MDQCYQMILTSFHLGDIFQKATYKYSLVLVPGNSRDGKSRKIAKMSRFKREIPGIPGVSRPFYPFPFPGNFFTGKYGNTTTTTHNRSDNSYFLERKLYRLSSVENIKGIGTCSTCSLGHLATLVSLQILSKGLDLLRCNFYQNISYLLRNY
jgi:hypothetical protein